MGGGLGAAGRRRGVIARSTARRGWRSGLVWGYVFGLTVASAALGFASTYKTAAQRAKVSSLFASNAGLAAINGPAHQIQSVSGYTAWKSLMFLTVAGAAWGLLLSTRLLRGEEEAGRWELLMHGPTTRRGATAQAMAGAVGVIAIAWAIAAVIIVAVGRDASVHISVGSALFFATSLVAGAVTFAAVGALGSQLAPTRRQAAAWSGVALGVAYALRMVADSRSGLAWMRWATPLGWVEELEPLTHPHPWVFANLIALVAGVVALALWMAGRRDVGAGILRDKDVPRPRTRLLGGATGLAVRLTRPTALGWVAGIGATGLLMGLIAKQGGSALDSAPSVRHAVGRLGIRGGGAAAYLGFTFLIVAVMVAFVAAGQVSAARSEEAAGRVEHLLVRRVSRLRWLYGRWLLAVVVLVAAGLAAGILAWAAAASQGAAVGAGSVLAAGLNVVAPALCVLGVGVAAIGIAPRASTAAAYGLLAWSLVVEVAGGALASSHWLLDTSVFHQMAPAPAVVPDWMSTGVMVGVGTVAAVVGAAAFARRDIAGE